MKKVFSTIEDYIKDDNLDAVFGSVPEEELWDAEKKLKVTFHPVYIQLIKRYGAIDIYGQYIYGMRYVSLMGKTNYTVVDKTLFYKEKQQWPGIEDWYIISDDGRGNPIGCKPDGSVWLSDHDARCEHVKLADNFEEFLEKLLNDTLYA